MHPQIAFLDIENAPNLGWTWDKFEQNVIAFKTPWFMLSYAVKWKGEKKIHVRALCDYPDYKKDKENDKSLVEDLRDVFDRADIIIAHNGDRFDIRKSNARFIANGLLPPSTYKTIDTLKIARRYFKFTSNSLNELAATLDCGAKLPNEGFHLWKSCMEGDPAAWVKMKKYNAHDIVLLEKVYARLAPWHKSHPDITLYGEKSDRPHCPACASDKMQRRGFEILLKRRRYRYQCQDCGKWSPGALVA